MGCDIHAHIELLIDGKWEHYKVAEIPRVYTMFGKLAGVRASAIEPISAPRGLPDDISVITKIENEIMGSDGHSRSWINRLEFIEFKEFWDESEPRGFHAWMYSIAGDGYGPEEMFELEKYGITDMRMVFWFDN